MKGDPPPPAGDPQSLRQRPRILAGGRHHRDRPHHGQRPRQKSPSATTAPAPRLRPAPALRGAFIPCPARPPARSTGLGLALVRKWRGCTAAKQGLPTIRRAVASHPRPAHLLTCRGSEMPTAIERANCEQRCFGQWPRRSPARIATQSIQLPEIPPCPQFPNCSPRRSPHYRGPRREGKNHAGRLSLSVNSLTNGAIKRPRVIR